MFIKNLPFENLLKHQRSEKGAPAVKEMWENLKAYTLVIIKIRFENITRISHFSNLTKNIDPKLKKG
jgi:hypothetical protein